MKYYRPYKTAAEIISDFYERFNKVFPITIKNLADRPYQILSFEFDELFEEEAVRLLNTEKVYAVSSLLENFTYIDGSPCGKQVNVDDIELEEEPFILTVNDE